MGRPRTTAMWTIAQLESLLKERVSDLEKLYQERGKAMEQLESIDARIKRLGGTARNGEMILRRPRNTQSLVQTLRTLLTEAGKPLSVTDIVEGALAAGYRSSSDTFRGIVNQTLIKERKYFTHVSRGMYAAKK